MPKVLVVEDQPSVVAIVRYHLENGGFQGVFAGDVESGWRNLVSEGPDASVIDIKLPGADGWSLIEKIRRDGRFHNLPIVVLTGLMEPDVATRVKDLGCEYLSKPFAASALLMKLQGLIKEAQDGNGAHLPVKGIDAEAKIDLVAVGVVILLDQHRIEGIVHLPPELPRFSDGWESIIRDPRGFVPVTGARVTSLNGSGVIATPPFMEVSKDSIRAVFPLDMTSGDPFA